MSKSKVVLIDADFLLYVCCHNKQGEEVKDLSMVIDHANEIINNILNYNKADSYIGCLTVGKCFRYDIYPEYKANRNKTGEKPAFFEELRNYLLEEKKFIFHVGLEADDLIAILAKYYKDTHWVTIVSTDKDLQQIPGKHFNPMKFDTTKVTKEEADLKLWTQVLTGDSTDNIKGLTKCGKVNADKIMASNDLASSNIGKAFRAYLGKLGEYQGILEFTKNYRLVKLVDEPEYGFDPNLVSLIEVGRKSSEEARGETLETW